MEAYQRRQRMFEEELIRDLPVLRSYQVTNDHHAIRQFAHKYKMRLDYLGYSTALNCCSHILELYDEGDKERLINSCLELIDILQKILSQTEA